MESAGAALVILLISLVALGGVGILFILATHLLEWPIEGVERERK